MDNREILWRRWLLTVNTGGTLWVRSLFRDSGLGQEIKLVKQSTSRMLKALPLIWPLLRPSNWMLPSLRLIPWYFHRPLPSLHRITRNLTRTWSRAKHHTPSKPGRSFHFRWAGAMSSSHSQKSSKWTQPRRQSSMVPVCSPQMRGLSRSIRKSMPRMR